MKYFRLLIFFIIIIGLSVFSIIYPKLTGRAIEPEYEKESAMLIRVIDGDTIETDLGKVRLLGINTPEKKMPFSNESKEFLKEFENKTIQLLRDKEDTDKYNRKLRYLFYNNRFLNIEILENGFASSYMTKNLKYEKEILRTEEYARKSGLGIWQKSQEKCAEENCIKLEELNETAEYFIIKNICGFSCILEGWFVKDAGRNTFWLKTIKPNEEQIFNSSSVWNNDADNLFMFDKKGKLVIYYSYQKK